MRASTTFQRRSSLGGACAAIATAMRHPPRRKLIDSPTLSGDDGYPLAHAVTGEVHECSIRT